MPVTGLKKILGNLGVLGNIEATGTINGKRNILIKTAAFNPKASESGTTYGLSLAAGYAVLLPTPQAGLWYRFVVHVAPTGSYTITATSDGTAAANILYGPLHSGAGDAAGNAAAEDVITIVLNSAVIGDWVEVECLDSTHWAVRGSSTLAASITIA